MDQKLGEIAEIQFGSYEKYKEKGSVKYLHAGHFDDLLQPTNFEKSFVELDSKNDKFLLKPNDVILAGKGHRIFAWAYDSKWGEVMPSSLFYILRTDPNKINGKYLASYLNSDKVQFILQSIGAGATIPSIPKKELQELSVVIPTVKEQARLVEFVELLDRNISLTQNILERKKDLKRGLVNNLVNKQ